MGLLPFKKKTKPASTPQSTNVNIGATPTTEISRLPSTSNFRRTNSNHRANVVTPGTAENSTALPKWSPMKKILSSAKSNDTNLKRSIGSTPLPTVNVAGKDSIEVMTLESQQKLMDQREAIRKKLFESSNNNNHHTTSIVTDDDDDENTDDDDDDRFSVYGSSLHTPPRYSRQQQQQPLPSALLKRSATDTSQEILANGRVQDTIIERYSYTKSSDRFSLPIQQVSRSWDTGSLLRIAEEPVDYGAGVKSRSSGPISVDLSYTESELASVITRRFESDADVAILKPTESIEEPPIVEPLEPIPSDTDSPTEIPNSEETTTDGNSDAETASTGMVVGSPANTSRSSAVPMDEQMEEMEIQRKLNTGKSPLRGMPEDEQDEYQKDEMELLPTSPLRNFALGLTNMSSFQFLQKYDSKSTSTTIAPSTSSVTAGDKTENKEVRSSDERNDLVEQVPSTDDVGILQSESADNVPTSQPSVLSRVPDVGRSILKKVSECSSGALSNTTGILNAASGSRVCADPTDAASIRGKMSIDETESLSTTNTSRNRPVFLDETSALRFLRRITNNGFVLLYLQPPEGEADNDDVDNNNTSIDDWKGRTVTIVIQRGQLPSNTKSGYIDQERNEKLIRVPILEWTTVTGGYTTESKTTSIDLLNIQSISMNDEDDVYDDDDLCFFTITSEDGDIHVFETANVEERDRIVNGLKTLIARWSFHVIAGEVTATSELFDTTNFGTERDLNRSDDDLPSLPNPHLAMNYVAHMLLDVEV